MPCSCCVFNCTNRLTKEAKLRGLTFHAFPTGKERRMQWIGKVRRVDPITGDLWEPGPGATVCSAHFLPNDFCYQWGRKLVKPDCVPTVFDYVPPVKKRKLPAKREIATEDNTNGTGSTTDASALHIQATSAPVVTEHTYAIGSSPRKLLAHNNALVLKLRARIDQLKNARKRESRLRGKLSRILDRLNSLNRLSTQTSQLLEAYKDIPLHLFSRKLYSQFTTEQKQFATTLHYYSPAAYQYLRRHFKLLPSPRTIRDWLSGYNGQPCFMEQSFTTLAGKTSGPDA